MSELKPITVTDECGSYSVYSKSDVDTVIEEKDRAIEFAKALTLKDIEIIKEKDKEIAELKESQRWRKFSEEKPDDKQVVLVHGEEWFETAIYHDDGSIDFGDDIHFSNITEAPYWMPLPAAPKEADK